MPKEVKSKQAVLKSEPEVTICVDANRGSMMLPYKMIYALEAGWLLCVDGAMVEIVDMIAGKGLPGQAKNTPHAILQDGKGKRRNLYLKGHRLVMMAGRKSSPVVHCTIVSKGHDSDLIKVADEATIAAQNAEATLTGLALGATISIMARRYTVLARESVPVKPRSKVTQAAVYLRANDGSLHTLRRDGTGLVLVSGRKSAPARGLKIVS